jgi:pyruvate formate lyase activating enzyme
MSLILFTATGCTRCQIAKKFMHEKSLVFEEHDAIAEGKELFGAFYRAQRAAIIRGADGVEFPVLADGSEIRQGVAAVIAWLQTGARLDGFIGRSEVSKGWVGGLHVSKGDPAALEDLLAVLGFLKRNGLKLQLDTDGRNAAVLERLFAEGLGDRVIMDLKGPQPLYAEIIGGPVDTQEIQRSMTLVGQFPEYRFETTVAPIVRAEEGPAAIRCLTPDEVAETARWLKAATGSHRQPYILQAFDPQAARDDRFRSVEMPATLFRHRSAARKYQVLTEINSCSRIVG